MFTVVMVAAESVKLWKNNVSVRVIANDASQLLTTGSSASAENYVAGNGQKVLEVNMKAITMA